jgi:hypothetical protein
MKRNAALITLLQMFAMMLLQHNGTVDARVAATRLTRHSGQRRLRRSTLHRSVAEDREPDNAEQSDEVTSAPQSSSSSRGQVDLVHLVPFDVQIAVTKNKGIQTHEVANIVTTWLNNAYGEQLQAFGFTAANHYAVFEAVVLFNNEEPERRRGLRQFRRRSLQSGELFTAKFRGGAVFSRDETRNKPVPANDVLLIQQMTLLNDTSLVELLQSSSVTGLGSAVVDVNAFLAPQSSSSNPEAATTTNKPKVGSDLKIVIVAAVAVAIVAFLFLLGAIVWAYSYDRTNREAFLVKENKLEQLHQTTPPGSPDRTDTDTVNDNDSPERIRAVHVERSHHTYPTVIGGEENDVGYPESVISDSMISGSVMSEDISTSLSQYYRSGMGKVSGADYGLQGGLLSDAGSVSSMESYGYSLDGGTSAVAAAPLPSEIPYHQDRDRIGGLPVVPANMRGGDHGEDDDDGHLDDDNDYNGTLMDDVQIPDLDKELANLDIQLIPNMEPIDVESYSPQDLEKYQMQDLEEMEALSQRSPHLEAYAASPSNLAMGHDPVDVDNVNLSRDDDDDDENGQEINKN